MRIEYFNNERSDVFLNDIVVFDVLIEGIYN